MEENKSKSAASKKELILVTGGSGFIGSHSIIQLLKAGYLVRTTVRSPKRKDELLEILKNTGVKTDERLSFAFTDLTKDEGWKEAVSGCDYVLHMASPFPPAVPKNEDELIIPAREGALRVLRAARDAGVKRVVLTSSFAAVGYGHPQQNTPFTETNWTNLNDAEVTAYVKSKTLAEKAAWNFINTEGNSLELSVVNPVGVFGPVLAADYSASIQIVQRLMDGSIPGCPKLSIGVVDVRDVVDLHIKAMTSPAAKGERFLAVSDDSISMFEMGKLLKKNLGVAAKKVPSRELPNWLLRSLSVFDASIKQVVPELGKVKNASSEKAIKVLNWKPRTREEAILSTAKSLIELGLINKN